MDIQRGQPSVEGRYVVYSLIPSRQVIGWMEPNIATWHAGRWHHSRPVAAWTGPLPVLHVSSLEDWEFDL